MPRHPRIAFPGACYHILNRGGARAPLFEDPGAARVFESCLRETCERMGWSLLAYALVRERFHLAIQTPRGNLVEGMHWLETTFAVRCRRFRRERGHLFQGRYAALLVEPGPNLARVVNHIHLDPFRAGASAADRLHLFPWCSLRAFVGASRPGHLVCAPWLRQLGFTDTPAGWAAYRTFLKWLAGERQEGGVASGLLARGWALGSPEWRNEVRRRHGGGSLRDGEGREAEWESVLRALLARARRSLADARTAPKGAPWKIQLARTLRARTTATNSWIADRLCMGTAGSVSVLLSRTRPGS